MIWIFGANKTHIEVIKEGALGGTYFRDIYFDANAKWYRKWWREFNELKRVGSKYYCSNYYDIRVNKYGARFETS